MTQKLLQCKNNVNKLIESHNILSFSTGLISHRKKKIRLATILTTDMLFQIDSLQKSQCSTRWRAVQAHHSRLL